MKNVSRFLSAVVVAAAFFLAVITAIFYGTAVHAHVPANYSGSNGGPRM